MVREIGVTLASLGIYEVLAVEAADTLPAGTARHDRNAVHIRFGDHRFHRGVNIKIRKLSRDVPVEETAGIRKLAFTGGGQRHVSS
jgi:hypothetical protein